MYTKDRKVKKDELLGIIFSNVLVAGIALFFMGFHSVDLAVHYFQTPNWHEYVEVSLTQNFKIDEMYMYGIIEMVVGLIISTFSAFWIGYFWKESS